MLRHYVRFNSIFFRLLCTFLLIIAPIIITGVVMFSWEKQTIHTEIEKNTTSNVSFLKRTLESEVQATKSLQYNLTNDLTLQKFITEYNNVTVPDYYTMIANMQNRLQVMKNSNAYIEDVILFVPGIDHSISAENGYQELQTDEYWQLLNKCTNAKYPVLIDNSGIYALLSFPFTYGQNTETPLYLVEVKLSQNNLKGILSKFSQSEKSNTVLYDYTSQNWIFSLHNSLEKKQAAKLEVISNSVGKNFNITAEISGEKYFVVSEYSKDLNFALVQYVPIQDVFRVPDRYENFMWIYMALSILILIFYSYTTYRLVKNPINKIVESFRRLEQGALDVNIQFKASDEFNYLYEEFNTMVDCLNTLIDNNYKQQIYIQKAELKQLQSQINPHFLYNSYFILRRMILDRDFENAENLSNYLGTYFQYITRNVMEGVTLQKEMEHAISYARIQQMRFSERMAVEFGEVPPKYRNLIVPRLIMQPILENSIEHGLNRSAKGGLVRILFEDFGDGLHIFIEDSGASITDDKIRLLNQKLQSLDDREEITGIINVHRRLRLKFGPKSGIQVSRSTMGGLKTKITIITDQLL